MQETGAEGSAVAARPLVCPSAGVAMGRPRHEALRDHAAQHAGELEADLRLLMGGEDGEDAVDGLRRIGGVERREDEMPRLRGEERRVDGLVIAHLADEDDVGALRSSRHSHCCSRPAP